MIKNLIKAAGTAVAFYATLKLVDTIQKNNNVDKKAKQDAINTAIDSIKK